MVWVVSALAQLAFACEPAALWRGSVSFGRPSRSVVVWATANILVLIRQVIQGGGNMHAYGKNLSPAETTALVAFLKILHPAEQLPARDASRAVASEPAPSRPAASNP